MKKRMTEEQEFEILKLVFDKFLWLGFIFMGLGAYLMINDMMLKPGIWFVVAGVVPLLILIILIVKEYEIIK